MPEFVGEYNGLVEAFGTRLITQVRDGVDIWILFIVQRAIERWNGQLRTFADWRRELTNRHYGRIGYEGQCQVLPPTLTQWPSMMKSGERTYLMPVRNNYVLFNFFELFIPLVSRDEVLRFADFDAREVRSQDWRCCLTVQSIMEERELTFSNVMYVVRVERGVPGVRVSMILRQEYVRP